MNLTGDRGHHGGKAGSRNEPANDGRKMFEQQGNHNGVRCFPLGQAWMDHLSGHTREKGGAHYNRKGDRHPDWPKANIGYAPGDVHLEPHLGLHRPAEPDGNHPTEKISPRPGITWPGESKKLGLTFQDLRECSHRPSGRGETDKEGSNPDPRPGARVPAWCRSRLRREALP